MPGIEPASVLRTDQYKRYAPFYILRNSVGMPGIEPGFYAPEAYIIPLYDIPTLFPMASIMPLIPITVEQKKYSNKLVGGTGLEPVTPPV